MAKEYPVVDDIRADGKYEDSSSDEDSSSSSSSSVEGPLNHLSDLMAQLPIKRGLSKYYSGKSQSFASLGSVRSLEEMAKKDNPYNIRMKLCRSHGEGLDGHLHKQQQQRHVRFCTPKPLIAKKSGGCSWRSNDLSIHVHK